MITLEEYFEFINRVEALAHRWIKAWKYASYTGVSGLTITKEKIRFHAGMRDGIGLNTEMDIKYISDSSTLEADAESWYRNLQKEREDRNKRLIDLEATKEVREYKSIQSTFGILDFRHL